MTYDDTEFCRQPTRKMTKNPGDRREDSSWPSNSRAFRSFTRWMTDNNVFYSNALEFVQFSSENNGIRARTNLAAGDLVATIPKTACLTSLTCEIAEIIEEAGLGDRLGLAVALMYERSRGDSSRWFPYLSTLPDKENVPFVWPKDDVDRLLKGTEIHEALVADRALMRSDWQQHVAPLSVFYPDLFPASRFTYSHYLAARTLIASRAFQVDERHGWGMVPLADLFNHKTGAEHVHFTVISEDSEEEEEEVESEAAEDRSKAERGVNGGEGGEGAATEVTERGKQEPVTVDLEDEEGDPDLEMIIIRDVAAGDEVFNTYGHLSTAALLHRYGFTEGPAPTPSVQDAPRKEADSFMINNPFDICNVDVNLVIEGVRGFLLSDPNYRHGGLTTRMARSCVRICSEYQFPPLISQSSSYYEFNSSGTPQTELLLLLKLMLLSEEEVFRIGAPTCNQASLVDLAIALGWKMTSKIGKTRRLGEMMVVDGETIEDDCEDEVRRWILSSKRVRDCLLHVLSLREGVYPGNMSLNMDRKRLRSLNTRDDSREYHALVVRVSEREVLQKCRELLDGSLKSRKLR